MRAGAIVPAGGGRTVFVLPWLGPTLVGTTDNDYEGSLEHVPASDDDVAYLLDAVNGFFGTELGPPTWPAPTRACGPLISTGDPKKSVDISRKAELYETSSGLVTITGGKLTTWRRMAKMAVDRIVEREGREAPCRTARDPARRAGRAGVAARGGGRGRRQLAHTSPPATATRRSVVLRLAEADPALARAISPELPDIARRGRLAAARTSRRARWPTCCCAAPGSGCWTRGGSARRTPRAPRRGGQGAWPASSAGTTRA